MTDEFVSPLGLNVILFSKPVNTHGLSPPASRDIFFATIGAVAAAIIAVINKTIIISINEKPYNFFIRPPSILSIKFN